MKLSNKILLSVYVILTLTLIILSIINNAPYFGVLIPITIFFAIFFDNKEFSDKNISEACKSLERNALKEKMQIWNKEINI